MNKKILLIIFVFTISIRPQFITGVAPLEMGNFWIYQEGDYNRLKMTVVGDTLMDSVRYWRTSLSNIPGVYVNYRLNDSGYYAQRLGNNYPGPNHERAYYKNYANFGDYWSVPYSGDTTQKWHFTVMDTLTGIVFGKESLIKFIYLEDSSGLWGLWQWWTDEFGMIFESADYAPDVYIKGCYIDGIAYGDTALVTSVEDDFPPDLKFYLYQNYPNPFNPSTIIEYTTPEVSHVLIKVYDILGREVAEVVNGVQDQGNHQVLFDAKNLSNGVYIYSVIAKNNETVLFRQSKQMILMK